jgi:hypothetical protein
MRRRGCLPLLIFFFLVPATIFCAENHAAPQLFAPKLHIKKSATFKSGSHHFIKYDI